MTLAHATNETLLEIVQHFTDPAEGKGALTRTLDRVAPLLGDLLGARDQLAALMVAEPKSDKQLEVLGAKADAADAVHDMRLTLVFEALTVSTNLAAATGDAEIADVLLTARDAIFEQGLDGAELSYRVEVDKAINYERRLPPECVPVLKKVRIYDKPLQYWIDWYVEGARGLQAIIGDRDDLDPKRRARPAKGPKAQTRPQKLMAARGNLIRLIYDIVDKIERHQLPEDQHQELLGPFLREEAAGLEKNRAKARKKAPKEPVETPLD